LEESHNRLHAEVTDLQNVIAQLQTENQQLKNELKTTHTQLEDEAALFQTSLLQWFDEKSRKCFDLE
jgi:FtsZ-binding cell division protein ZapB